MVFRRQIINDNHYNVIVPNSLFKFKTLAESTVVLNSGNFIGNFSCFKPIKLVDNASFNGVCSTNYVSTP